MVAVVVLLLLDGVLDDYVVVVAAVVAAVVDVVVVDAEVRRKNVISIYSVLTTFPVIHVTCST